MRPINADALIEAINTYPKFGVDERCRIVPWTEGYEPYIHLRDAVIAITGMSTIEPERKKGKWIYTPTEPLGYICSECKNGCCKFNFCPNCGADMRGESDDIPMEYFESGGK